jgi:hypothetical protein
VLAWGCAREENVPVPERVPVRLSGEVSFAGVQTREGMIKPVPDTLGKIILPPKQLTIGIVSIDYPGTAPTVAQWGLDAYSPYIDRGYFGGNKIGDTPESMGKYWNGNIEYTNRDGTADQFVFYDLRGNYYHFVCVYPYDDIINPENDGDTMQSAAGATVYFNIDGSGDIMASTRGWGNNEFPFGDNHTTDPADDGILHFYHKLVALRCKFEAETTTAIQGYGTITSVELTGQPDVVGLNIGANAEAPLTTALTDEKTDTISYRAIAEYDVMADDGVTVVDAAGSVRTHPLTMEVTDPLAFGYVLALPATKYTFRIITSVHGAANPLYATYEFATPPAPGTIYNLTFKMLESAKTVVEAAEAPEWWLDQTFN